MIRNIRIVINDFKAILDFKKLLSIIVAFILIFIMKKDFLLNIVSLDEVFKTTLSGPYRVTENILEIFIWSFYIFYLIYLAGDFFYTELKRRSLYSISRIGNKKTWYLCIQVSLFLLCISYYLIGGILITICSFIFKNSLIVYSILDILNIIFILSVSSYFMINVYLIILLIAKSHNRGFLFLVILDYISIDLGGIFNIDKFMPLNQGMIIKHNIEKFSCLWSYMLLIPLIVVCIILINYVINKKDLLAIID